MLTELDIVNACLATMGQAPIVSLTRPHRLVAAARGLFIKSDLQAQSVGWWFNTRRYPYTITAGFMEDLGITAPILQLYGVDGRALSREGNSTDGYTLYDHAAEEYVTGTGYLRAVLQMPFADLPTMAKQYINDLTVAKFQSEYDGDSNKSQRIERDARESFMLLNSEHIRVTKTNLLNNTAYAMYRARGTRPFGTRNL